VFRTVAEKGARDAVAARNIGDAVAAKADFAHAIEMVDRQLGMPILGFLLLKIHLDAMESLVEVAFRDVAAIGGKPLFGGNDDAVGARGHAECQQRGENENHADHESPSPEGRRDHASRLAEGQEPKPLSPQCRG